VITTKFGSEEDDKRSVSSRGSSTSDKKFSSKALAESGRIPKKSTSDRPEPIYNPSPLRDPLPTRSDPGWRNVAVEPQPDCYILKRHGLEVLSLGSRKHIYRKLEPNNPLSLVHVTLKKKSGLLENFVAESICEDWTGVPHLPFEYIRYITPQVMSAGFVFGKGLLREMDPYQKGYKKWERMTLDPYVKYSFCSIPMLDLDETKTVKVPEERFKLEWIRNGHLPIYTHQTAQITLLSDDKIDPADFTFMIHLVDLRKSSHFGLNQIVLGEDFLERYLYSADGSYDAGRLYFVNKSDPPKRYRTTVHPKHDERGRKGYYN